MRGQAGCRNLYFSIHFAVKLNLFHMGTPCPTSICLLNLNPNPLNLDWKLNLDNEI